MSADNSDIVKELFKSTKYMIDASLEKASFDKTVKGIVLGASNKKNHYQISINGKTYTLPSYINNVLKPNTTVHVMIPQNSMDLAFIYSIFGGEEKGSGGGGDVTHADTADYATTAGFAETVKIATDKLVGGVLSSSGTDKVSVDPNTGIMSVGKVSNAINAENAISSQNAQNAQNAVHASNSDNATHSQTSGVANTVENVPIATEEKVGGIISSSGVGKVSVDSETGEATVELPPYSDVEVATETKLGGVVSSNNPGELKVSPAGNATIVDVVTIKDSGSIEKPDYFGSGPWKLVCTENNSPDNPQTGLPSGGNENDVLVKSSNTNYDAKWSEYAPKSLYANEAGNGVPSEGLPGQILQKSSIQDYSFRWVNGYSNQNLLDNWYFLDPINQRSIESDVLWGSRSIPYIDRWHSFQDGTTKWVADKGIVLLGNTINSILEQYFRYDSSINGRKMMLSIVYYTDESSLYQKLELPFTYGEDAHYQLEVGNVAILLSYSVAYYGVTGKSNIRIWNNGKTTITIVAAKLEYDKYSTLYNVLADGSVSIKDPPPNKAIELTKCQRWMYVLKHDFYVSGWVNNGATAIHAPIMQMLNMEPVTSINYGSALKFYMDCAGYRKTLSIGGNIKIISNSSKSSIYFSIDNEQGDFTALKSHTCGLWGFTDDIAIISELSGG